ncbi:GNAT family N-acetyltransferase [Bradyrhizobium icense]|uniref:Acetyltransferase n=1 Tax=Bradyrhizobium icense TaxID=1274631 RepID=A0A1B1URM3_9BRAD|nr:GNAT family N-acetyltransferase [Bradyrhizobium icense]ANW05384.1 acetyltransferase [Bradyrhizobium icense]
MSTTVRDAIIEDAQCILEIYNFAVTKTTAVWSEEPSDIALRQAWFRERTARGFPILVAESAGRLVGFASFGDFRPWPGYRHTVENSVYVAPWIHRQGVGRALMQSLIDRGVALGKHVMVAGIEETNTASIRLHNSLGFREVGRMPHVGTKFGRWLDLVLMQRYLVADREP